MPDHEKSGIISDRYNENDIKHENKNIDIIMVEELNAPALSRCKTWASSLCDYVENDIGNTIENVDIIMVEELKAPALSRCKT